MPAEFRAQAWLTYKCRGSIIFVSMDFGRAEAGQTSGQPCLGGIRNLPQSFRSCISATVKTWSLGALQNLTHLRITNSSTAGSSFS